MENNKKYILIDENISLKTKGLYMLIKMQLMINGKIKKDELMKMSKDGKEGFNTAWRELKEKGYLIQERDNKNKEYKYELK